MSAKLKAKLRQALRRMRLALWTITAPTPAVPHPARSNDDIMPAVTFTALLAATGTNR